MVIEGVLVEGVLLKLGPESDADVGTPNCQVTFEPLNIISRLEHSGYRYQRAIAVLL